MRRLALAAILAASIWVPVVATPPAVQAAATCTGWTSSSTPPTTIRVYRSSTKVVQTVDFETYVKVVMPAEWPSSWPTEALRAGAIAIKQYAWYYTMHYRGGTVNGSCFDVVDNTNDQIYDPTRTQYPSHIAAVDSTWPESILKSGALPLTGYRSGGDIACGGDRDGVHLFQHSARYCALAGYSGEQILSVYFYPGLTFQGVTNSTPGTFHPLPPTRLLDSRDGTGGLSGKFTAGVGRTFQVTGQAGVPAGASAVTGNLTVTQQNCPGYLYIGPVALNTPSSSSLNFPLGDDRANAVSVALGPGGKLGVTYVALAPGFTAHVVFDVTGYYTPDMTGATYTQLTPTRILDTRDGTGGISGALTSNVAQTFMVWGNGGVPTGATAVTGNLTVTQQSMLGFLYVGPVASNSPATATLDFPILDDRANAVTVALAADGQMSITYSAATAGQKTHAIFDVTGYYMPGASGARYVPVTPIRLLDSRTTTGGLMGFFTTNVARTFPVGGVGGVPNTATAVTGNLTVTQQTMPGYLYIGPVAMNNPTSSTLNFPIAEDRANSLAVALGTGGKLSVTYVGLIAPSYAHAVFDVTGYFIP